MYSIGLNFKTLKVVKEEIQKPKKELYFKAKKLR